MISIRDITISYDGRSQIIDKLNVDLEENAIHALVGLNGSGKTTLLNALYGLIKKENGAFMLDERSLTKKEVAYLPTENFFYSKITGHEYLSLFSNSKFKTEHWNQLFELPLDEMIDGYSTGMRKKLALLGVLKENKAMIILDEPFNGLDIESCRVVRSILLKLKEEGKTILITSHIMETLTNLCDFIHLLESGSIQKSVSQSGFEKLESEIFQSIETKNEAALNQLFGK